MSGFFLILLESPFFPITTKAPLLISKFFATLNERSLVPPRMVLPSLGRVVEISTVLLCVACAIHSFTKLTLYRTILID